MKKTTLLLALAINGMDCFAASVESAPRQQQMDDRQTFQQLFPDLRTLDNCNIGGIVDYCTQGPDLRYVVLFRNPLNYFSPDQRSVRWPYAGRRLDEPIQTLYPRLKKYSNQAIGELAMRYNAVKTCPVGLDKLFLDRACPGCVTVAKQAAVCGVTATCLILCCDSRGDKAE